MNLGKVVKNKKYRLILDSIMPGGDNWQDKEPGCNKNCPAYYHSRNGGPDGKICSPDWKKAKASAENWAIIVYTLAKENFAYYDLGDLRQTEGIGSDAPVVRKLRQFALGNWVKAIGEDSDLNLAHHKGDRFDALVLTMPDREPEEVIETLRFKNRLMLTWAMRGPQALTRLNSVDEVVFSKRALRRTLINKHESTSPRWQGVHALFTRDEVLAKKHELLKDRDLLWHLVVGKHKVDDSFKALPWIIDLLKKKVYQSIDGRTATQNEAPTVRTMAVVERKNRSRYLQHLETMGKSRARCEICDQDLGETYMIAPPAGKDGKKWSGLHVHHKRCKARGTPELDELAALCPNCHAMAHYFVRLREDIPPAGFTRRKGIMLYNAFRKQAAPLKSTWASEV